MRVLRLFALGLASVVSASNTNAAISKIVDALDVALHQVGPALLTLQAEHKFNDVTVGAEMAALGVAFLAADTALAGTTVSSGSTTVSPTDDDISITYADAMALLSTSLSGVTGTGAVPQFPQLVAVLDPIVAKTSTQLNLTLPGSIVLVNTMMRDARQFFIAEGFNKTVAALGF